MKKLLSIVLIGVILILSGCMADSEVDDENPYDISIRDYLVYDFGSMSFSNTSDFDIMYLSGTEYLDYLYVYKELTSTSLSDAEIETYGEIFLVLDAIAENKNIALSDILTYSSSEFNNAALEVQIPLSLEGIVIFNTLKTKVVELEELSESNIVRTSKIEYIEYILDTDLTQDEIDALEFLQEKFSELYLETYDSFDFSENTLEDLLVLFDNRILYTPSVDELADLEIAYNIMLLMNNN